jgi:hypothetical protein
VCVGGGLGPLSSGSVFKLQGTDGRTKEISRVTHQNKPKSIFFVAIFFGKTTFDVKTAIKMLEILAKDCKIYFYPTTS